MTDRIFRQESDQVRRELRWLLNQMKYRRGMILLVGLLGLAGTMLGLGGSLTSKYLIDALAGGTAGDVLRAGGLVAAVSLAGILVRAISARRSAAAHIRLRSEMQHSVYARILNARWEALEAFHSGDLLSRLNSDVAIVSDGIIGFLPGLVSNLVRMIGAFCIVLAFDPVMAFIALAGIPVTMGLSGVLMKRLRRHELRMKELAGEVMSFQEDSFRNLTSIKAFHTTQRFADHMGQLQRTYADAFLSFRRFQADISAAMSVLGLVVSGGCFAWCGWQLWNGRITYGSLALFLQLAGVLRSSFSALVSMGQQLMALATSAGRVAAVEALPPEQISPDPALVREKELAVHLEQTGFRYRDGRTVLQPFDFYVNPGEFVAVTGPSGEGKTTLLRILLGLVAPDCGRVVLRGREEYPLNAASRCVFSYVPQGNSILTGTVAENLRLVKPEAEEEELIRVLEAACAWEFVKELPDGLNHRFNGGGRGLSEGQAQRLAVARALLKQAPILLLDEATSALDGETERRLLENLRASGLVRSCVLVTHRPSAAGSCDRTYEILDGRLREIPEDRRCRI